jgi:two-component system, sensor histidine kinase
MRIENPAPSPVTADPASDAGRLREVAHELRSPLGGIESMIELLSRSALDDSQRRLVAGLLSASRHLRAVAGNIIDNGRVSTASPARAGDAAVQDFIDIRAFLSDLAVSAEARASIRSLGFTARCATDVPLRIEVSAQHLRQMLENLIDNAFKHARSGSVRLDVGVIDVREGYCGLRFAVRDQGDGIRADQLDRLFRPHSRVEDDATDGAGIGLSIVRRLARESGGDAGVESRPGEGSTFWFTLRVRTPAATPFPVPPVLRETPAHVLVVDDSQSGRTILCAILGHFGYRTTQAASAEDALDMLANGGFDAVTVDRTLPGISGEDMVRRLRRSAGPEAAIPVVAITGHVLPEQRRAFLAAGANGFVPKPVTAKAVLDAVAEALVARQRLPAA